MSEKLMSVGSATLFWWLLCWLLAGWLAGWLADGVGCLDVTDLLRPAWFVPRRVL